jgi:hypothetical protein
LAASDGLSGADGLTSRVGKNARNNSADVGNAVNNPAFPGFGNLWRDLLRQWEDAGNSLSTDAMRSPEFSKFMNQATSSSAALQRVFADLSAKYLSCAESADKIRHHGDRRAPSPDRETGSADDR